MLGSLAHEFGGFKDVERIFKDKKQEVACSFEQATLTATKTLHAASVSGLTEMFGRNRLINECQLQGRVIVFAAWPVLGF